MKKFVLLFVIALIPFYSCNTAKLLFGEPSEEEVVMALKEMLNSGALKAVLNLQQLTSGGGILPDEVQSILGLLNTVGFGDDVDKVTAKISQISADVASESGQILKDSIKELNFGDAVSIVLGGKGAATRVLKEAMYTTVKKRYSDKLAVELDKVDALQYWPLAAGAYNLFAKEKMESSLPDFLAERAVDALFLGIGAEENKTRDDPGRLGKQVVKKVFDFYQNRQRR